MNVKLFAIENVKMENVKLFMIGSVNHEEKFHFTSQIIRLNPQAVGMDSRVQFSLKNFLEDTKTSQTSNLSLEL